MTAPRTVSGGVGTLILLAAGAAAGFALFAGAIGLAGDAAPLFAVVLVLGPAAALAILHDPRWGLVAIIASFPVGVATVPVLPMQLVQVVAVVVFVLTMLHRLAIGRSAVATSRSMLFPAAFCGWLVLALASALDQRLGLREVVLFLVGLLVSCVVVANCQEPRSISLPLWGLLLTAAGVALTVPFSLGNLDADFGGAVVTGRATGIFAEPNQMGTFSATGALVGMGLAFAAEGRARRWLSGSLAALCVLALLLSLSRGAWIGFFAGLAVMVVKLPTARRALLAGAVPLLLLAVAAGAFAPSSPEVAVVGQRLRSLSGEDNPYDNRPAIWREGLREATGDLATGSGPGNFPAASTRSASVSSTVRAEHAHNLFLTWAAEDGLPAVGIVLGLIAAVVLLLRQVAAAADPSVGALAAGTAAALAAVVGQGLVDYTLRNSVINTTVFLLLGCVFALERTVVHRASEAVVPLPVGSR